MRTWLAQLMIAVTAVCLNVKDVKNAECDVACKREGAHAGYYVEKQDVCACVNYYDYKKVTRKTPQMNRVEGAGSGEPEIYYVHPAKTVPSWED